MFRKLLRLIFPPKCLLCKKVLLDGETDMCGQCRCDLEDMPQPKFKISFVARWTALWYYNGKVRSSILRYKFRNVRNYAPRFGRLLAQGIVKSDLPEYDILTWVPISPVRKFFRGYDQVQLIADFVGRELKRPATAVLQKVRHTKAQSGIQGAAFRRANVLGAYRVKKNADIKGKRILLLDDVVTTGATLSECAKVLLTAGAKEIYCAALAASNDKKEQ